MEGAGTDGTGGYRPGRARRPAAAAVAASLVCFVLFPPASARTKTDIDILPGPSVMSAEEKAIAADPVKGIEHGVILVEETELDDDRAEYTRTSYHMRAKILSNEARDLANVVIPYHRKGGYFKTWWGRTILPDGSVHELPESALQEQSVVKGAFGEVKVLKGALPAVVAGCVIDYGYVIATKDWQRIRRVPLQRAWPMQRFRYRWVPYSALPGRYHVSRTEGFKVEIRRDLRTLLFEAQNLSAVVEEPWMPPVQSVRGTITLFYSADLSAAQQFWDKTARSIESNLKSFMAKDRLLKEEVAAALPLPPQATLEDKLSAAYDWIAANVKNSSLRSVEELESDSDSNQKDKNTAEFVLSSREGRSYQLDSLYIAMARLLGAEAHLVLAPDRREHFWDRNLLSMDQFDADLVAVRAPGEALDAARLVDPGSGLPYAQVPWWLTGTIGMIATKEGAAEFTLFPSQAQHNVSETRARIGFGGSGESRRVVWSRQGTGQRGYVERRHLRGLQTEERVKHLDNLCGASGVFEVSRAEAPGLENLSEGFRLECEGVSLEPGPRSEADEYLLPLRGDWIEPYADFGAARRVHPVVLPYRRADVLRLAAGAPEGFVPAPAPPPISLETPFGSYALRVRHADGGFQVERTLVLTRAIIPAAEHELLRNFFTRVRYGDEQMLRYTRRR